MASQFSVTAAQVRDRAREISSADVNDTDLDLAIKEAESVIHSKTGKSDWVAADDEFEALQGATKDYAAATALLSVGDPDGMAPLLMDRFKFNVDGVSVSVVSETFSIKTSSYRSSPLKDE